MSNSRLTVLLVLAIVTGIAGSMLALTHFFGRVRRTLVDSSPYECGMKPYEYAERHRFSIHFYVVAMLFILFDIEAAFLIPWAVTFQTFDANKVFVLGEMFVFLGILVVGFVYVWKRGALEWE